MPWTWLEFAEQEFTGDGYAVRPVKRNGTNVEDACNSCIGTETDQVDGNAEEYGDPDGIKGSSSDVVDLSPDIGGGKETITRECKDGSS